ncbi:MAG: UTP--glucose-1-phosphate uridylyltransferase [Solirubrobacteraceae bacterium MAG38_C4-C5]|nr:UTP--glucose-1-phosphate uridylyltransferase [Candidatus Siliceabacter maunaloa]
MDALEKMRAEGLDEVAVAAFAQQLERLEAGEQGLLREADIAPVDEVPALDDLSGDEGQVGEALERTVVIKLNGGLGTSMGMSGPKSLLELKDGLTFLDVSVRQVQGLRERTGARLPLVLMNSFATRAPSLEALDRHGDVSGDLPPDFLQGRVPKLRADDLSPVDWADEPSLEWAPPGHGDLYGSLLGSGMLDTLARNDYAYACVSNVDNLGAVVDPRILAWFAREEIPFLMEVARRTGADRKGGHLAQRSDGGLVLREVAQTTDEDLDAFQDIERHRFFNTNTLWIDLRALRTVLDEHDGVLGLPMIVNRKTVDPADKGSTPVIQIESAMGAAIDVFEGARAVCVPRTRLAPVKTTNDLLVLRSDAYDLDGQGVVLPARPAGDPVVDLDPDHFKLLADFEARFPAGPPSLRDCDRLTVAGDVTFGAGVAVRGTVRVEGPTHVEAGTVLTA